jgi:preprotein translocase subunit SecG
MISFLIGLLYVVLFLDCLFLILLVLVQLPKKEAGMGQAFGGAATDALFGAGSGNALTKLTKWGAAIFFALAIVLTVLSNFAGSKGGGSRLQRMMQQTTTETPPPSPAPAATTTVTPPPPAANAPIQLNAPATPATDAPPAGAPVVAPTTATPAPAPGTDK